MRTQGLRILITGATGLVGRYLMRDLIRDGHELIVVARPRGPISAQDRIEAILQDWDSKLEQFLLRPQILEGDLRLTRLGMDDHEWKLLPERLGGKPIDVVIHSAASLRFVHDPHQNEPYRSNVEGTRNVIELSRHLAARHFLHVSTAYTCGDTQKEVPPQPQTAGTRFNNVYEETKCQAEDLVLAANNIPLRTIARPSVIIGDSRDGYSSTFHTVYSFLRFLGALPEALTGNTRWLLDQLQLETTHRTNLVPVDWVSRSIVELVERNTPLALGSSGDHSSQVDRSVDIYHLTHPNPTSTQTIIQSIKNAIALEKEAWNALDRIPVHSLVANPHTTNGEAADPVAGQAFETAYESHVRAYQEYLKDDPVFLTDYSSETQPKLKKPKLQPPPPIDGEVLTRCFAFAIQNRFRDPTPVIPRQGFALLGDSIRESLSLNLPEKPVSSPVDNPILLGNGLTVAISGPYGGTWKVPFSVQGYVRMNVETLEKLVSNESTLLEAIQNRRVLVRCNPTENTRHILGWIENWLTQLRQLAPTSGQNKDSRLYRHSEHQPPTTTPNQKAHGGRKRA